MGVMFWMLPVQGMIGAMGVLLLAARVMVAMMVTVFTMHVLVTVVSFSVMHVFWSR